MAKKFLGLQYPLEKTPKGILAQQSGVEQIKADLLQLLLTNPGERVMMPSWGTPLKELVFEPNDPTLELEARRMIANAIALWEPRIELSNITVTSSIDTSDLNYYDDYTEIDSILNVKIEFYDPENITEIQSLQLELPLGS